MTRRGPAPDRTGPQEQAARLFELAPTAVDRQAIPAQVRRRRAAADRCEPLGDGRRDPFERDRRGDRWTSGRTLHVQVGRRSAWWHGGKVLGLLDKAGVDVRQWDYHRRLWMVPVDRVDDVIVCAEHPQRRVVTTEAVNR